MCLKDCGKDFRGQSGSVRGQLGLLSKATASYQLEKDSDKPLHTKQTLLCVSAEKSGTMRRQELLYRKCLVNAAVPKLFRFGKQPAHTDET